MTAAFGDAALAAEKHRLALDHLLEDRTRRAQRTFLVDGAEDLALGQLTIFGTQCLDEICRSLTQVAVRQAPVVADCPYDLARLKVLTMASNSGERAQSHQTVGILGLGQQLSALARPPLATSRTVKALRYFLWITQSLDIATR